MVILSEDLKKDEQLARKVLQEVSVELASGDPNLKIRLEPEEAMKLASWALQGIHAGEFICKSCGLRVDAVNQPRGDF